MSIMVNCRQDMNNRIIAYAISYTIGMKCYEPVRTQTFLVEYTSANCLMYDIDYLVGAPPYTYF